MNQIRQSVLDSQAKQSWFEKYRWQLLAPAMAATVLAVVLVVNNQSQKVAPQSDQLFYDLELLTQEVEAEFLEDLEFIAWLEEEEILDEDVL